MIIKYVFSASTLIGFSKETFFNKKEDHDHKELVQPEKTLTNDIVQGATGATQANYSGLSSTSN